MVRDCLILITSTFSYVVVVPKRHCLFLSIIIININKNFVESNNLLSLWYIKTNTMKLKQLFLAVTITLFAISCTKQDTFTPQPNVVKTEATTTLASSSVGTTSEPNLKAYIFVEPHSKFTMVANYLNTVTQSLNKTRFLGFFVGPGASVQYNLLYYIDMPHWYDGRLPSVIEAEIPQVSGGTDSFGNTKTAYNFTTVKIPKNTVSGFGWINILIPVSAMSNDTKRQKTIYTYEKIGNTLVTNGTVQGRSYNMNSVMYSYTFNYQGNRIPKGVYRLYTTYPDPGNRANLNSTKDYYLRGNGN